MGWFMALGLPHNFCSAFQTAFGNMVKLDVSLTPDPCKKLLRANSTETICVFPLATVGATKILQLQGGAPHFKVRL
jgi:hypothetical protein